MRLGFNFLLWTTHVTEEHLPILDAIKATGYDGVEIPVFEGNESHFAWLRPHIENAGLQCTAAGAMPSGSNPISPDLVLRAKALDHLKWASDCCAALGAELFIGPIYQPLGEFTGQGPTEDEKSRCVEIHKQAAQYAGKAGVKLSVEPLNRFECYFLNTADAAAELVRRVDEPAYGYLYDTFHFNIEENSLPDAVTRTIGQINHVHISENNRGTPGTGHIDFTSVFRALRASGYDGWMTVEAFGSALPDLSAATKIWRPLFASPEDVYRGAYRLMRDGWDVASDGDFQPT
ncbi:sugar phosphate isomerase/epimerase family protein [Paradevosia shaoguanensis]|uniref:sugar phosphate isomerase/epimerase family protein n=1 Tax=Paradevosia shaoguanensis TaxID=1335043 RepID=UPI003C7231A7